MEAIRVDSKGEKDYLPGTTADAEYAKPLKLNKTSNSWLKSTNPSVTDTAILETKKLLKALNKNNSILDKDLDLEKIDELGLKIYTTVDKKTQDLAEKTVKNSCRQFKNPETNIALVSIDPESHQTRAIVGGCHIDKDYVNRANNSKRQAGSSFKVFVYGAAFQAGYKTSSPVNDSPRSFDGGTYTPKNYGGGFSGKTTFGEALIKSMNVPAVVIGQRKSGDKKIVELAIDFARSVGITTPLDPVTSLPLGSKEVIPIEMANAYATIANGGNFAKSTVIYRIVDSSGRIIVDNTNRESKKVLKTEGLIELHKALKGVVTRGTGTKANIGRPTIGKTGTTENQGDVWFVGSTPQLATAVWIGNNKSTQKLGAGATGGGFAAPVWRNFNAEWHKDKPVQDFNLK
jgi:penicillin-binding protein 1A